MAKVGTVTALDIGTSKVVCAIAELSRSGNGLEIVAKGVAPCCGLSRGALVDSEETVGAIEAAVNEAEASGYAAGPYVVVGLTSEYLTSRPSHGVSAVGGSGHEITDDDVRRVMAAATLVGVPSDTEIVKVVSRGFVVDGQRDILNPIGLSGVRLETDAYVSAASVAYLQNIRKVVGRAGLELHPNGFVPASLASSLAVLTEEERSLGVVMIDIGLGTLDLSVYCNGEIGTSAVFPMGGWVLANDVACYFNIPRSEAEKAILECGIASPEYLNLAESMPKQITVPSASGEIQVDVAREVLAEVLEARLKEVFAWVTERIEHARTKLGLTITSLVLTGGASQLPGLSQFAAKETELPTRVASPCYPASLPQFFSSPIYSTVVGLLLYGSTLGVVAKEKEVGTSPVSNWFTRLTEWLNKVF